MTPVYCGTDDRSWYRPHKRTEIVGDVTIKFGGSTRTYKIQIGGVSDVKTESAEEWARRMAAKQEITANSGISGDGACAKPSIDADKDQSDTRDEDTNDTTSARDAPETSTADEVVFFSL